MSIPAAVQAVLENGNTPTDYYCCPQGSNNSKLSANLARYLRVADPSGSTQPVEVIAFWPGWLRRDRYIAFDRAAGDRRKTSGGRSFSLRQEAPARGVVG